MGWDQPAATVKGGVTWTRTGQTEAEDSAEADNTGADAMCDTDADAGEGGGGIDKAVEGGKAAAGATGKACRGAGCCPKLLAAGSGLENKGASGGAVAEPVGGTAAGGTAWVATTGT